MKYTLYIPKDKYKHIATTAILPLNICDSGNTIYVYYNVSKLDVLLIFISRIDFKKRSLKISQFTTILLALNHHIHKHTLCT